MSASTPKTCIVLCPVLHPKLHLGDVVPARSVVLVRHGRGSLSVICPRVPDLHPIHATTPLCAVRQGINSSNRRMRTRLSGGVGGEEGRLSPLSRLCAGPYLMRGSIRSAVTS